MPVYEYKCECGNEFEDLNRMSERHRAECIRCGKFADMVVSAPRIDPNCDLPGARMTQRRKMEERGRGRVCGRATKKRLMTESSERHTGNGQREVRTPSSRRK